MKPYFFGYLYVRLAKLLAAFVFIGGVVAAIFSYSQASLESRTVRYRPSTALSEELSAVKRSQAEARQIVVTFHSAAGPASQALPALPDLARFIQSAPDDSAAFERLGLALAEARSSDAAMKAHLLTGFESSIQAISSQLLAHARTLAPDETPVPPATPEVETPRSRNGLFSESLSSSEVRDRATTLEDAKDTLRVLASQSEKAENKQTLFTSAGELESLQAFLPVSTLTPPSGRTPDERPSTPHKTVTAELIASKLQQMTGEVRHAIASAWSSTLAIEASERLANDEAQRCREAELSNRRVWQRAGGLILLELVGGAFLAFLLLAMTDLTRALLDAASHAGVVAETFRHAQIERSSG